MPRISLIKDVCHLLRENNTLRNRKPKEMEKYASFTGWNTQVFNP